MQYRRAATVAVEIAHHSVTGALHGHTLMITAWTRRDVDLDAWKAELAAAVAFMENGALEDVVGRTFEEVAAAVLTILPGADRVQVGLPSRGHTIEANR